MNKVYKYKTKQNLEVIFVKKEGFVKSYCGIGTRFGASNVEYILNDKQYKAPYGIAHFIEHKLFQMEDGSDAFTKFSQLNCYCNAYTSADKTIYYFTTCDDIFKPLKLLLEMYFTPVFIKEDVQKEKNIIINEIHMYDDKQGFNIMNTALNMLYPNDNYSYPVAGLDEDVINTTEDDLLEVYNAFYTPNNSSLVIIGDFNKDELFKYIDSTLETLKFSYSLPIKLPAVKSNTCLKPASKQFKINQDELVFCIRIDNLTNKDSISCEKICCILDSLLSISSSFYKYLDDNKLFTTDLDYQVVTHLDGTQIIITGPSKKAKKLALELLNKFLNLEFSDLDKKIIELYLKYIKSDNILKQDNISSLGDEILSLSLENIDYFKSLDDILSLDIKDLIEIIRLFKTAKYTYLIAKAIK